jgi:ferredoxin-NADP reductase/uncharacterized protein YcbX
MAFLQDIMRYPIKGFSGESLSFANLKVDQGLPFDRHLAFTNGQKEIAPDGGWTPCGAFVRLTKNTDLPRFRIAFNAFNQTAIVSHPDGRDVRIARGDEVSLAIANTHIAAWFPQKSGGPILAWTRPGLGYWDHDDAALSIINLDSVEQLSRLAKVEVDPRRFRGNLLIKGGGAWSEFDLLGRQLQIGDAVLEVLRPIDRCSGTSVHPDLGEVDINLPALLARHAGHIYCGVYARVIKAGNIKPQAAIQIIGHSSGIVKIASERPTAPPTANWPRSAKVTTVQRESESVTSFWLHDRLSDEAIAPGYIPGQHIRLHGLGPDKSSWRNYTISARSMDGNLRISVKRDPKGTCSGWLHDTLKLGHHITISGPFGSFIQPANIERAIIMLSAGIGITPLLAMLSGLAADVPETIVRFVHVCRSMSELALWDEVVALKASMPNLTLQLYIDQDQSGHNLPAHVRMSEIDWDDEVEQIISALEQNDSTRNHILSF